MERKIFYQYLWSAILTSLSGTLCVQIDGIIVSHLLGAEAFAAIGTLMPLVQIQLTLCLLIGVGGALRLAYAVGAQDHEQAQKIFRLTTVLLLLCSLPFVLLSAVSGSVAGWFCHEASLMPLTTAYGRVLLLSAPVYLLLQGSGAMVRAEGFPKRILWVMILANVLNLSLDVLFIQVFRWGIAGAGWATTLSNGIALVLILTRPHSHLFADSRPTVDRRSNETLRRGTAILLAGAPVALGSVAMFIRLTFLTTFTSEHLGAEGMVILSLLLSVFLIVNLLAGGTTQALQPVAGQYLGQGNTAAMYRTCRRALRFTALSSIIVTILVILLAKPLCHLYGIPSTTVAPSGGNPTEEALRIFALCYAFYSLGYVLMVVHQIIGNKTKAMLIAIVQPLMVIPIFALFVVAHVGGNLTEGAAFWSAFPIAEIVSLIFILLLSTHELRLIYTTATGD